MVLIVPTTSNKEWLNSKQYSLWVKRALVQWWLAIPCACNCLAFSPWPPPSPKPLTGARPRLIPGLIGRLSLRGAPQTTLALGWVAPRVNTVAIRRSPVRAFKVTIKHATWGPVEFTTFALFVASVGVRAHAGRLHVQGAALGVFVHKSTHRGRHCALVFRTCAWSYLKLKGYGFRHFPKNEIRSITTINIFRIKKEILLFDFMKDHILNK